MASCGRAGLDHPSRITHLACPRLWQVWAPDLRHLTVTSGHFMADQDPDWVIKALRDLLTRPAPPLTRTSCLPNPWRG